MSPGPATFVLPCLLGCVLASSGWTLEIRIGDDPPRLCLRHAAEPARSRCSDEWREAIADALSRNALLRAATLPFSGPR